MKLTHAIKSPAQQFDSGYEVAMLLRGPAVVAWARAWWPGGWVDEVPNLIWLLFR